MSGQVTVKQILELARGEIAWMRIYPEGNSREFFSYMSPAEIEDAARIHGDKHVKKIYPGFRFIFLYL